MDLELTLSRPDTHQTQIAVACNDQPSHTFDLHTLIPNKTNGLPHPLDDPVAYGMAVYAALFPPGNLAQQMLAARPKRILLVAADDVLDAIPWEYMYGPDGFVVSASPFVRGLPAEQRIAPPDTLQGLHLVAVASSPLSHALAPLNIQGEWTRLTEIVQKLKRAVILERAWPPTIESLRERLAGEQQRVVHFMGHGGQHAHDEAVLCLEQDSGAREDVTAREAVQRVQGSVLLVTLNACQSATPGESVFGNLARALVREHVPYALGMRFSVHDDDALAFSRAFYSDLARGVPVEEALRQARLTLAKSERAWAIGNLVLYTALAVPPPGFATEPGEPVVQDAQEDALRGIMGVLPAVQGAFQGRIDEQIALGNWLTGDRRPRIMTIHGGGGQGKTALSRVAAERFAHAWSGGVWAITLETVPTRAIFVASLARFLGISPPETPDPADLERNVLLRLHRRRTLLVLDNLETLDEAAKARDADALALAAFIQQLPGERTSLLCTSRHLLGWNAERSLELPGLSPDEGAALFQQSAPQREDAIDPALTRLLSQRIDGHPLGLFLLGKAFNETSLSLAAFVADYETFLSAAEDLFAGVEHRQRTLYANVAYSVKWLPPDLRSLFSKLWLFHAPFLPETAIAIVDPEHETRGEERSSVADQLHALWQRGLLTREGSEEGVLLYRVPPVMRPYIERYLADTSEREPLLARFGMAYANLVRSLYRELGRGGMAPLLAVVCRDDLERGVAHVAGMEQASYLLRWAWVLHHLGDRTSSLALTERALEMAEAQDRSLEFQAIHNIAGMYSVIGKPQEALRLFERALPILQDVGDQADEAATLNNMAGVYQRIGKPQEALRLFERALPILQDAGDRVGEANALNGMAKVYRMIGKPQEALRLFERALPILQDAGDRVGEANALNGMAGMYADREKPQEALRLLEQALSVTRETRDRQGEAATLNNMAGIYAFIGQPQEALRLFEQALPMRRDVEDRAGEAATLSNMAVLLYRDLQQPEQAIVMIEQAIDILRKTGLPRDAAGQTPETLERILQTMRSGTLLNGQSNASFILPAERVSTIVATTIAVMTFTPENRAEWHKTIAQLLQLSQLAYRQFDMDFFLAVLAIVDGQRPTLPADHPYAQTIAAILKWIT